MADQITERPFDNYKTAITDPPDFFGRSDLLTIMRHSPFQVRILLGGRRLGKTSALRAVEWNLLNPSFEGPRRVFPVFISLEVEQPSALDRLLYTLIARLREAINRWQQVPLAGLREMYRQYLRQVSGGEVTLGFLKLTITNPDQERRLIHDDFRQVLLKTMEELRGLQFDGVCFLLDEAEFIVCQDWANDAWSYFRGLKDNDTALKSFLGLLLSGYRNVKEYDQRIGSPLLNIADVRWLNLLTKSEVRELIIHRSELENVRFDEEDISTVVEWAGGHPYLTQQLLNTICDDRLAGNSHTVDALMSKLLQQHDRDFSSWWNMEGLSDGFSDAERLVYRLLIQQREGTLESLSYSSKLSIMKTYNVLEILSGTGVIQQIDDERYMIGSKLFEKWVSYQ